MEKFIKVKNIIVLIINILFIIGAFIHFFLYKFIYDVYILLGNSYVGDIEKIIDSIYYFFTVIFIIVIIDLIIDLWYMKKFKVKILSSIVIIIFIILNIFSAPFNYIGSDNDTYKLDNLLTIMDFSANEGDFEGGGDIKKYIYIPFSNKLIIFDGFKIKVEKLNTNKFFIVDDYYDESWGDLYE